MKEDLSWIVIALMALVLIARTLGTCCGGTCS